MPQRFVLDLWDTRYIPISHAPKKRSRDASATKMWYLLDGSSDESSEVASVGIVEVESDDENS